jgi:hypothetical protein
VPDPGLEVNTIFYLIFKRMAFASN